MGAEEPSWMKAKRGIRLLIMDKNNEAEKLFNESPKTIQMTAGICYVTFMNALMCFDDHKVTEALLSIKEIEDQCTTHIGWMKTFKNKMLASNESDDKKLEKALEEKIVLADSLVCQSFLTFLHNDFTSYMKGGWTLRKAWKIYQYTYDHLFEIHEKMFGSSASSSEQSSNSPASKASTITNSPENSNTTYERTGNQKNFYSCSSKTFAGFPSADENYKEDDEESCALEDESKYSSQNSLSVQKESIQPKENSDLVPSNVHNRSFLRKSVSLFSSLNSFGSVILEGATSLIGLNRENQDYEGWENLEPDTVLRLMSAVCFGYGVFQMGVSLAPPSILRMANMLGFEGDIEAAIRSLNYCRKGNDMRAPLASLALLWYHTIINPFLNLDGSVTNTGIEEAEKILKEEKEYENSALFLFFRGRIERLKPNIPAAVKAYELSVKNASLADVKLLGLHEVGWCYLLSLDYKQAHTCFLQLRQQSKWSRSFYAYLTTITAGANGYFLKVLSGKTEIKYFLAKSCNKNAQIEKYIQGRVDKLPQKSDIDKDWVNNNVYWQLCCFEMLYLWNTFPSCSSEDLKSVIKTCTPAEGLENLPYEPIEGIGWLMNGAASVVLGNRLSSNSVTHEEATSFIISATNAFRMCLNVRKKCLDHAHISAFAQYELALLLLRDDTTRPEGKSLLTKLLQQYKDYDFENRLNARVSSTLRKLEKYESQQKGKG